MNLTYLSLHCIIDCNNKHMMYWHFVFCKVNQTYHLLWDKLKVKSLEFVKEEKKTLRKWNVNAANYFLVFWLKLDQTPRSLFQGSILTQGTWPSSFLFLQRYSSVNVQKKWLLPYIVLFFSLFWSTVSKLKTVKI